MHCMYQMIIVALEVRANFPLTIASRLGTKVFSDLKSDLAFIWIVSSSSQTDRAAAYISKEAGLLWRRGHVGHHVGSCSYIWSRLRRYNIVWRHLLLKRLLDKCCFRERCYYRVCKVFEIFCWWGSLLVRVVCSLIWGWHLNWGPSWNFTWLNHNFVDKLNNHAYCMVFRPPRSRLKNGVHIMIWYLLQGVFITNCVYINFCFLQNKQVFWIFCYLVILQGIEVAYCWIEFFKFVLFAIQSFCVIAIFRFFLALFIVITPGS